MLFTGKGGKNRRRGKNENENEKRELVFKEDGQGTRKWVKNFVMCEKNHLGKKIHFVDEKKLRFILKMKNKYMIFNKKN